MMALGSGELPELVAKAPQGSLAAMPEFISFVNNRTAMPWVRLALGLLGVSLLAAGVGCGPPAPVVSVDGSSTVAPLTEAVSESLYNETPVRVHVGTSGTGGGFEKFIGGEIDICDASRPAKEGELALLEEAGIEFVDFTVAVDGLAVVVHPENDWVDCLTVEQLAHIWRNEDPAMLWSDVDPTWPQEEIKLFGPDDSSGTFDYFTDVILDGPENNRAGYDISEDDNQLVTGVSSDKHGLGYFGFAYYEQNKEKLKLVAIDSGEGCVLPGEETVASGEYHPLSRPLFLYVRIDALANEDVVTFVRYYLNHAHELAPQVGYVGITPEVAAENQATFEAALKSHAGG